MTVELGRAPVAPGNSHLRLIRYWRACVADVALGKGLFRTGDLPPRNRNLLELSTDELLQGRVEPRKLERLFKGLDEKVEHVQVCLWPLLVARRTSHGAGRGDGLPEHVAPIAAVAQVARKGGGIRPLRTVIARDILEPLPEGAFSVGTVADLDTFLTGSPFSSPGEDEPHDGAWQSYREDCRRLLDAVAGGWPREGGEYEKTGKGLIEVAGDAAATTRQILALYDNILATGPKAPLLETYTVTEKRPATPYRAIQGMPLQQDGARHGLQTRPGGTGQLAPPRRTQPVAQADRRRKVHRRNRSRQATTSSRRLTQTVTKIRL